MRIFYKAVGVHAEVAQEKLRVPALEVKAHEDVGGGFEQKPGMPGPYPKPTTWMAPAHDPNEMEATLYSIDRLNS